ncbi:MAG: cysteine synthase A [Candidatus Eisenbacteria bacterium]|nr:cysteine synthase A [Candidatus Eisenbacteria bacterium]
MGKIFDSVAETIGRTPLVRTPHLSKGLEADVLFKLESFNPMSSVKDRIGYSMIQDAIERGVLGPGTTLIEPTSGNTGIALAFICAARKIPLVLTMPDTMSLERRKVMAALGARVVLTDGTKGVKETIARAEELNREIPNSLILGQFTNPANPEIHRKTTAVEIWDDTEGKVDIFVSGVGTGGTITGVGEVLKSRKPSVRVYAVEPANSPVITQAKKGQELAPGPHKIQGIGTGFIPKVLNLEVIDDTFVVADEQAFDTARRLAREEGLMVGISSGAAAYAAYEIARRPENRGKQIVAILPSHGERYLSTPLFDFPETPAIP